MTASHVTAAHEAPTPDKVLYRPPKDPVLVEVPTFDFVSITGSGDPNTSDTYQTALSALYSYSYPIVIALKKLGRTNLKVSPLEGLWWAADFSVFGPSNMDKTAWNWKMMIRQPDDVPGHVAEKATAKMTAKVGDFAASQVHVERFEEGLCAQLMHHGPYAEEGPNVARLHEFIASQGLQLRGHHHEVYLSNPRRANPEKMRTILRQPVSS